MNIGLIKRLGEQHPEVLQLLAEWQSLSKQHDGMAVALMRRELAEFDRNHTRADAQLGACVDELGVRIDSSAVYARDLNKRLKKLEAAQNDSSNHNPHPVRTGSE